ncbi:Poly-beta-1,6-N-acetyl-D-glucosamine synthase [Nymphon striatum]|nr:Poly-beta-1,6-N-acetyl-D-glucosamine synthase [Nymphon striatum]
MLDDNHVKTEPTVWPKSIAKSGSNSGIRRFYRKNTWRENYQLRAHNAGVLLDHLDLQLHLGRQMNGGLWSIAVTLNKRLVHEDLIEARGGVYSKKVSLPINIQQLNNAIEITVASTHNPEGECNSGPELLAELLPQTVLRTSAAEYYDPVAELRENIGQLNAVTIGLSEQVSAAEASVASELLASLLPENPKLKPSFETAQITVLRPGQDISTSGIMGADALIVYHNFQTQQLVVEPVSKVTSSSTNLLRLLVLPPVALAKGDLFSAGWRGRTLFGLDMSLTFIVACTLFDWCNILAHEQIGISFSLHFSAIGSGLLGFAIYSFKLLERGYMPARIRIEHIPITQRRAIIRIVCTIIVAAFVSVYVGSLKLPIIETLRNWTLLGGIGPGVFLFLPYIIKDTIEAMDRAAQHYRGDVHILIMNNNSTDDTEQIANEVLASCSAAKGRVINVPTPGKSHALNEGLEACETEFLVRVDADTLVGEDNLTRAMAFFANPKVGVVGGVPVPPGGALFDRARLLEVLVKHGFYSVAMGAVNSVVGIPGMFVVYRTEHPRYLGGFVEGMNGEDTDISLRIGELGFHSVVDPKIRYVSEVPSSYLHMREQRMRWFRSIYHISSRCRDLIYGPEQDHSAMLVPLVIFGAMECAFRFNPESPIVWQAVVAVTVGAPAIMAVLASLLNGVPRGIIALPEYLIFRVLRAYFTLESMLSILVGVEGEDLERVIRLDIVPDKSIRIA